ncbi:unnamed protein product [Orchesella dallaii]|uniref:Gustatory receptor n=1 Tax=Orchesella dallaii TaxID=48710 RepID=A0ABP1RB87_9HEXA
MERYTDKTLALHESLPKLLKPLVLLNYFLGSFPYAIKYDNNGKVNLTSHNFYYNRTLFTFFIFVFCIFISVYRITLIVIAPRLYDGDGEAISIISPVVESVCTFYANFITALVLGMAMMKRKLLMKFFNEMEVYGKTLGKYLDPEAVGSRVRRMYLLYGILGSIAAINVSIRCYQNPAAGPVSAFLEITRLDGIMSSETTSIISAMVVFYLAMVKTATFGYIEIVSIAISTCFSRAIGNIQEYLEEEMEIWRSQYKGLKSQQMGKDNFLNLLSPHPPSDADNFHTSHKQAKLQNELESYMDQIRELNPGLISQSDSFKPISTPPPRPPSFSSLKTTPGKSLTHAARKFQCIATMQNITNSVFGYILAINIGCVVGMSVILKYLIVRNLTSGVGIGKQSESNPLTSEVNVEIGEDELISSNFTTNIAATNSSDSVYTAINPYQFGSEWITFLGLDLSMMIRLGVTVICLGNVHRSSLQFNSVMGKAFLAASRLNDELVNVLGSDGEELAKMMMTPTQTSALIAFMNLNNSQPVAFTAGGLFVFSRGLILMIISIIISYLVFLLQA